jgi:small subunit ribosomal protein S21
MSIKGRRVLVQDGNFEKALRKFKKKISDMDLLQEVRDREQFVKPTVQRKLAKSQAKRRWQKYLRDQSLPKKLF